MKTRIMRIATVVGILLFFALVANFTVEGWSWGVLDFVAIGVILFITGLALDFVIRTIVSPLYKIILCFLIIIGLLLLWSELAVDAVSQMLSLIF